LSYLDGDDFSVAEGTVMQLNRSFWRLLNTRQIPIGINIITVLNIKPMLQTIYDIF